jgi:trehalose 6-phosphate phosphatase
MKTILSVEARGALDDLAARRALLAFDFDGTLAPIVADRDAAEMRPETRRLLRALALLHPCVVISGRARADVAARVAGIPLFAVVGNHGAEAGHGPVDRSRRARVLSWVRSLRRDLGAVAGIDVEDKWFSIAVHYRHVESRAAARGLVVRVATALAGAQVFGGHAVVNLVPAEAPDKGSALEELVRRAGAGAVLYAGDDRTDEDVFRSARVEVGVRVGRTARSAASWYVPRQAAVDDLLRALIAACTRRDGLGDRSESLARVIGR